MRVDAAPPRKALFEITRNEPLPVPVFGPGNGAIFGLEVGKEVGFWEMGKIKRGYEVA